MDVKTFRWNGTVGSFVVWKAQEAQKIGQRTGVKRVQTRMINTTKEVGWEVRVTATSEGFEWVASKVREVLVAEDLSSATPEWVGA